MYMDARVIVSYNIPALEGWKNLLNCMLVKGRLGMSILPSDLFFVPFKLAFTIHNRMSKWILLHF